MMAKMSVLSAPYGQEGSGFEYRLHSNFKDLDQTSGNRALLGPVAYKLPNNASYFICYSSRHEGQGRETPFPTLN